MKGWRLEEQDSPSIKEFQTFPVHTGLGWTNPILSFLRDGRLPPDLEEAKKIQKRATKFTVLNDELYKRGYSQPYLRCIEKEEARYVLEEVHGEIYGDHMGTKSLVKKIMRAGYFWLTMQQDTEDFVKKCDSCQRYGNVQRVPGEKMTTISSPWPFAQWGIDIMDPLLQGKRQVRFLLIAIDYFTKWVEAEALATITKAKVQNFVWKNIVCRFGIPRTIISDNGHQFDSQKFRSFCSGLGIKNKYSSPGHPQANGQIEVTNQTLLRIIKSRLMGAKGAWPEELPSVLWAYRTTARTSTGETPFNLTYGIEAVIPVEVGLTSLRREFFDEQINDNQLKQNSDCLDEVRDQASQRITRYQRKMAEYYNQRVKLKRFSIGDLVRAVHPIRRSDPPEDSDRIRPENRPTD